MGAPTQCPGPPCSMDYLLALDVGEHTCREQLLIGAELIKP